MRNEIRDRDGEEIKNNYDERWVLGGKGDMSMKEWKGK